MSDEKPAFDWRSMTPSDSPMTPMDVMSDARHKDLATADLAPGDRAYDFTSPVYDYSQGREVATGEVFRLGEAVKQKPVALVFGSYT